MALTQISTDGIKNGTITGSDLATNVDLVDDQKLRFGTGNDLEIYGIASDGTAAIINHANGDLLIKHGADKQLISRDDGAIELYYDDSLKFQTVSNGAQVIGSLGVDELYMGDNEQIKIGAEDDFLIYHGGSENVLDGVLHKIELRHGSEKHLVANPDGSVELYHDNSKKFETDSNGVTVTGQLRFTDDNSIIVRPTSSSLAFNTGGSERLRINSSGHVKLPDTKQLQFGGALNSGDGDLQIYHDGSDSVIKDAGTGRLSIQTSHLQVANAANSDTILNAFEDGAVELYHDNAKKAETVSGGFTVTGTCTATAFAGDGSALTGVGGIPTGVIVLWSGAANAIPSGFALCDGNNSTPDLRDRFVVGAGNSYSVGDTGGASSVTLTVNQIPSHNHSIGGTFTGGDGFNAARSSSSSSGNVSTSSTGGGQSHENRPPYYALCYIMKT